MPALMTDSQIDAFTPDSSMRGVLAPGKRKAYIFGGKATITIRSSVTGTRFTYKVTKSKPEEGKTPVWFVSLLNGSDNTGNYVFMGTIFSTGFRPSAKSRVGVTAPAFIAFEWLSRHWEDARVEVWHEGVCSVCGRKLTVPSSIESGIGPICESKGEM